MARLLQELSNHPKQPGELVGNVGGCGLPTASLLLQMVQQQNLTEAEYWQSLLDAVVENGRWWERALDRMRKGTRCVVGFDNHIYYFFPDDSVRCEDGHCFTGHYALDISEDIEWDGQTDEYYLVRGDRRICRLPLGDGNTLVLWEHPELTNDDNGKAYILSGNAGLMEWLS